MCIRNMFTWLVITTVWNEGESSIAHGILYTAFTSFKKGKSYTAIVLDIMK